MLGHQQRVVAAVLRVHRAGGRPPGVGRLTLAIAAAWAAGLALSATALADVTFTTTPAGDTNQPNATFQFTGTPAYRCSLDGATPSSCFTTVYLSGLSQGQHSFSVSDDCEGDTACGDPPETYTWTIDQTPPDITLTSHPPALTNQTTASFKFTSSDPTATFQCSLNGTAYAPCTSPQVYNGLTAGTRTFNVEAVDPAGNVSLTTGSVSWTVDLTPPVTTITGSPPALTGEAFANFVLTSSKSGSTFQCSLDGTPFAPCTQDAHYGSDDDPVLGVGPHTFRVRATDPAGNVENPPATVSWRTEAPPPAPKVTLSADLPTVSLPWKPSKKRQKTKLPPKGSSPLPGSEGLAGRLPSVESPVGPWTLTNQLALYWSDSDPNVKSFLYAPYQTELPIGSGAGVADQTCFQTNDCSSDVVMGNASASTTGGKLVPVYPGPNCAAVQGEDSTDDYYSSISTTCTNAPYPIKALLNVEAATDTRDTNVDFSPKIETGAGYYDDQYIVLTRKLLPIFIGDYVEALPFWGGSPIRDIAILATTCPTCGSIRVDLSGGLYDSRTGALGSQAQGGELSPKDVSYGRVINLTSKQTHHEQLLGLANVGGDANNAVITLRAVSGRPEIEGIGVIKADNGVVITGTDIGYCNFHLCY